MPDKYGEKKHAYKIVTLENSFHGRTLTTLAATGQDGFHRLFTPLTEGFVYAKGNDVEDLKAKLSDPEVCARAARERAGRRRCGADGGRLFKGRACTVHGA